MQLTGRTKEAEILRSALASEKPELAAIVGRRRVGKTFLVRSVYADEIVFEVTGLQKGSKKEQLQNFALALKYAGLTDEPERQDNWLDAFFELSRLIDRRQYGKKVVLFFDELPWMDTRRSGFLQGFSFFWNSWASKKNVVVAICGSAASWMIKKVINDRGGLHNRVTRLIHLKPFNLRETELFLRAKGISYPHYQLLQLYMALGGIPMYLEMIQPGLSPIENINRLCFEPSGYLRNEFQNLYAALFENHEAHTQVVRALAGKRKGLTREDLLRITKLPNGGTFSTVLDELTQSGFIGRYGAYGKKKKELAYRLEDQYSLFYLAFVEDELHNPTADFGQMALSQAFLSWSGFCFENICLYHLAQIKQVLANLISNAIKFTPPGGQIKVRLTAQGEELHLEVQDTGIGISEADLPHIFDRFYQAPLGPPEGGEAAKEELQAAEPRNAAPHEPSSPFGGGWEGAGAWAGTGIGLAHARELVNLMGGRLSARSEVGEGSCFLASLPIRREAPVDHTSIEAYAFNAGAGQPAISRQEEAPVKSAEQEHPQILIIEDNPDVVFYLQSCLEGQYNLNVAYNGMFGIEKALQDIPDLIISDVMLPEKGALRSVPL